MTENDIARIVVDLCYKIHVRYGPGLFESVYERILDYELKSLGLSVLNQESIPLDHKEIHIPVAFRADLIIENKLLIELKSVDVLSDAHYKQVLTYLKLTRLKLGLLINFGESHIKNGIHRIVNGL